MAASMPAAAIAAAPVWAVAPADEAGRVVAPGFGEVEEPLPRNEATLLLAPVARAAFVVTVLGTPTVRGVGPVAAAGLGHVGVDHPRVPVGV